LENTHQLILHNDDENNYLYVIAILMRYCNHDKEQAEQCAVITNNAGKCDIKHGNFLDILELKTQIEDLGLKVEMQDYAGNMY
jgi:ATP-dependent Clp protease adaptor protein ClpS